MKCGSVLTDFRIGPAVVFARSRRGEYQKRARIAPGVDQERTISGPEAQEERARGAPGVGQERTKHEMWFLHWFLHGFYISMCHEYARSVPGVGQDRTKHGPGAH